MTGRRKRRPNTSVDPSTLATLRSTRGRNAISSSAMRLRRMVVSVSAGADDIVPCVLVEPGAGFSDEFVEILEFFAAGAEFDIPRRP